MYTPRETGRKEKTEDVLKKWEGGGMNKLGLN